MKQSVQEHIVVYLKGLAMGAADLGWWRMAQRRLVRRCCRSGV